MKRLYWRSNKISQTVLVLITALSLGGLFAVETLKVKVKQPLYREKSLAAALARDAFTEIKNWRLKKNIAIDKDSDPSESGLIGKLMTEITSNKGHLPAKQTTVNPNFAAVMVHYLKKAGVEEGDVVAVGASGSFPAYNIATYAALQILKAKPIIISSASASQWGANIPGLSWLEMENRLYEKKVFSFKSVAASLGGIDDKGVGMTEKGKQILNDIITKYQIPMVSSESLDQNIEQRIRIYQEQAGEKPIKAYVNIGGGQASAGSKNANIWIKPGFNKDIAFVGRGEKSIMIHFVDEGIPIINLTMIKKLAERFELPISPVTMPNIGQGNIYFRVEYNKKLAATFLVVILVILFAFIRSDWGYRILHAKGGGKDEDAKPQQMV